MKTLFDYEFDKEDFFNFIPIIEFSLDRCEDLEKKRNLCKVYKYLCKQQEILVRFDMDSIHLGFSKDELDLVVCSVRDYRPLDFLNEDLLQLKCDCFDILVSTYFFMD